VSLCVLAASMLETKAILNDIHEKFTFLPVITFITSSFWPFYALQDLCEKNSNANMHFKYSSDVSTKTRYQDEFEMKMYFMITELLNNIMKHSEASKAKLTLIENDNQLTVTVADNGNGFKTNDETAIEGFGLHQIRAQLVVSTGKLLLNQAQKKGQL
jgi:glucose-6-phosphate-specific signal transduction histidine kinase